MNDFNRGLVHAQSQQLTEAHAAVIDQSKRQEFDAGPGTRAVELLETMSPSIGPVDDRVRLAIDAVRCLGGMQSGLLGYRALLAAASRESDFQDLMLRRKWLTSLGLIEVAIGRAGDATRDLVAALDLARSLGDATGVVNGWATLSLLASAAGQYEDALQFTSNGLGELEAFSRVGQLVPSEVVGTLYLNCSNALRRLGRLEEATNVIARGTVLAGADTAAVRTPQLLGKLYLLVSLHAEGGFLALAKLHLAEMQRVADSAKGLPGESEHSLALARAEVMAAEGAVDEAMALFEKVISSMSAVTAYDDHLCDALEALQRIARQAGLRDKADACLTTFANLLRANAERIVAEFGQFPECGKDVTSALREVDKVVHGIERSTEPMATRTAASTLQNLFAMAASASAVEERSGEHGVRVARLCKEVGRALGLSAAQIDLTEQAALFHDIAKATVPPALLTKTEQLTEHEAALLERHADDGGRLIERSALPNRSRIAEIIRLHHHPYDGVGAQRGIRADLIPIEARLLSACDRFDALVMGRPRCPAMPVAEALKELLRQSGREFDPKVVAALIETVRRIQREHQDLIVYLSDEADQFEYLAARRKLRQASGATQ